ncbi:MAG: Anthranilate synthase component 1 [Chlamydiae bacterium]|nr:Anthranilate synthase component 1 [Chlamydiota bacterium]
MKVLSLDEYKSLCDQPLKVPVYIELSSDLVSPIRVFYALRHKYKKGFILESGECVQDIGRYSFVGFNPKISVEVKGDKTHLIHKHKKQLVDSDFKSVIRKIMQQNRIIQNFDLPPLAGGAVGFMGYDAVRLYEKIPSRHEDPDQLPDIYFGFYETIIVFDHLFERMTLINIPDRKGCEENQYQKGVSHLKELLNDIFSYSEQTLIDLESKPSLNADFNTDCDDESYQKMVKKSQEYIFSGDIFQLAASRTFYREFKSDPLDVFRVLRRKNPSPFMFYLDNEDYVITGSSQEHFASLKNGKVEALPITGIVPRGVGQEDHFFEKQLLSNEKEIAKHVMLLDLARNDMASICALESVNVKDFKSIQRLSLVMYITSRVTGRIKPECDALDVMKAFMPSAAFAGAHKIRAMEIIDEIESSRRGIYGGNICYMDNLGNLDSCIAVGMALIKDGMASVRVGAGIVCDSKPEEKVLETAIKAKTILEAINKADRGDL